jgi:hypothetical protein
MWRKRNPGSQLAVTVAALRAALAEGWTFDPPVHRRRGAEHWYCDVILWRADHVRLLTLFDDAALRGLLAEHDVQVVARSGDS